jgi:hypothetical protein
LRTSCQHPQNKQHKRCADAISCFSAVSLRCPQWLRAAAVG